MEFSNLAKQYLIVILIFCSFTVSAQEQETINTTEPESESEVEADIQYVTGKLRLSLYSEADSKSEAITLLASGDELRVYEITGPYARVITPDEKEGWVKRGFLVKKKPAIILYKEVNEAYNDLHQQMQLNNEKNRSLFKLEEQIEQLIQENKKLNLLNERTSKQLTMVKQLINPNDKEESSDIIDISSDAELLKLFLIEYSFYLISLFILISLISFRVGEIKTENQVIKHFGGVKVW